MRENGSLMKDDDTRRLEVLSTEGRLFGKRECALLPHWIPNTRRRHAQETSRDPHPACRRPFVTHGSMTHHRVLVVKTQEQKGSNEVEQATHIVCDNAEPTPHAGIVLVTTQRLGDGDERSVRRRPRRRPFLVGGQ